MTHRVVFLVHHTGTGASANAKLLCATYEYNLFHIDLIGSLPSGPTVFNNLDEALESMLFKGWTWTFLSETGSDSLTGHIHQPDGEIYVFGSDTEGFDRADDALPGALINVPPAGSRTQALVSETVINHRYFQVDAP